MIRHGFVLAFIGAVLGLSPAAYAEPVANPDAVPVDAERAEVWGDPEENQQPASGWTWFGMGYESRVSASGSDHSRESVRSNGQGGGAQGRK